MISSIFEKPLSVRTIGNYLGFWSRTELCTPALPLTHIPVGLPQTERVAQGNSLYPEILTLMGYITTIL
jgi:hypothetical protein